MKCFADEILHAFESNGNLHLILGVCSGKIDSEGNDLKDEVATIIIPNSSAEKLQKDFHFAVSTLLSPPAPRPVEENKRPEKPKEYVGSGITIAINS